MFKPFTKILSDKNKDKTIHAKVDAVLAKMTLPEKLGQMMQVEQSSVTALDIKKYHIGSVLSAAGSYPKTNSPQGWLDLTNEFWQDINLDDSQISIPILYGVDAVHGHAHVEGATVFPHNIGLGAANDAKLTAQVAEITAKEVLATGVNWVFGPNLGVAKDYHWGRVYESYASNSDQVANFAKTFVKHLQQPIQGESLLACVKHWVGDGGSTHGIEQGDTALPFEDLQQQHIKPFVSAIKAGALTVMASFSSWNGTKCHGSEFLLTDILKKQLQFKGFVLSDMEGLEYISQDTYSSVAFALNAGIDMFMAPNNWRQLIEHLENHLDLGTVSINRINDAVRRILYVKMQAGLFDSVAPKKRKLANSKSFGCEQHLKVARKAVQKSLVLLKNDDKTLPLSRTQRIFVAGKNADNIGHQCGGFTIDWQGISGNDLFPNGQSIWQGIKEQCPQARLSQSEFGQDADPSKDDIAVVVIGEASYAEGLGDIRENENHIVETGSMIEGSFNVLEPYGHSLELSLLHPEDIKTIENIHSKGIKVVTVFISGRPLITNQELEKSNAFVAAWLPGSQGQGVSDILFGNVNFSGKLAFPWPKDVNIGNIQTSNKQTKQMLPLFPIGHGLTY